MTNRELQIELINECQKRLSDATVLIKSADILYECTGSMAFVGSAITKQFENTIEITQKLLDYLQNQD